MSDYNEIRAENKALKERISYLEEALSDAEQKYSMSRQHETKLANVFEFLSDALIITNAAGEIARINPVAEKLTGWKKEEAEGEKAESLFILVNADDREPVSGWRGKVTNAGEIFTFGGDVLLISKEKSEYRVSGNISPVIDEAGKIGGIVILFREEKEVYPLYQALRENEARLKESQKVAGFGHYIFDAVKGTWENSEALDEIFGIGKDFKRDVEGWLKIVHPDYFGKMKDYLIDHVLKEKNKFDYEYKIINQRSGKEKWVHGLGNLKIDGDGKTLEMFGVIHDITDRKQSEFELESQKERMSQIIASTKLGTWEWNIQTDKVVFNEEWANIIGFTLKELSPVSIDTWLKYVHPDDLQKSNTLLDKHLKGETEYYHTECRMKHRDGNWIWVMDHGKVITRGEDNAPLLMSGTHQDITDRKRAELAIVENANFTNTLLQAIPTPVFYKDKEGRYIGCNQRFTEIMGVTNKEMRGKTVQELWPSEHAAVYHKKDIELLRNPEHQAYEFLVRDKDGNNRPVIYAKDVFRDAYGKVAGVVGAFLDVSEQKRVEEELRSNTEFISAITNTAPAIIYVFEMKTMSNIYVNSGIEKLLGFTAREISEMGEKMFTVLIHPDDLKIAIEFQEEVKKVKDGEVLVIEYRMRDKWENWHIFQSYESPFKRAADGSLSHKVGVAIDITAQKEAEMEIENQARVMETIFENTPNILAVVNDEYKIEKVNSKGLIFSGKEKKDIIGQCIGEAFNCYHLKKGSPREENDYCKHCPALKRIEDTLATKKSTIGEEIQMTFFDGKEKKNIDLMISTVPLKEKENHFVLLTLYDITYRKHAERALKESEEKYRLLFDNMVEGFALHEIMVDDEGKAVDYIFLEANDAFSELTGLKRETILGKRVTEILPGIEKDSANWIQKYGYVALKDEKLTFEQYSSVLDEWFSVQAFSPRKNIFATVFENITQRKKADEELNKHREKLEELVKERTKKLKESNQELESFAYSVSHDLRAPLRAIGGFSEILQKDFENKLGMEGQRLIGIIIENTRRMNQLITDILHLSRVSRQDMNFQDINMKLLAASVFEELTHQYGESEFELDIEDIPDARADKSSIKQVWYNLIDNALKYSSKSSVKRIEIGCETGKSEKVYFVRDYGAGFDMDYYHKLFGVFQRLHKASEYEGTGVGLAVVNRIIKKHGGEVWAESEPDVGSTFSFSLPRKE